MRNVVTIVSVIFVLACSVMGGIWGRYLAFGVVTATPVNEFWWVFIGGAIGMMVSAAVLFFMRFVTQELYERLAPAVGAVMMAMLMGFFASQYLLLWIENDDVILRTFITVSLVLVFGFIGILIGLTRASNWETLISAVERTKGTSLNQKLVDTSVLIDGRIKDICAAGFVEGTLLVPRFVLQELQNIADSSDVMRRAKGRRGLDILKELQSMSADFAVRIIEENPADVRDVDGKLVRLARQLKAKVLTNDFNLNKVAQIEGVLVLNINDLANALKPMVLPDEQMQVKIIKEGKEANQGVGYLDDGTMIVVDGGREHLGKSVEVLVTSVLQTAAGRMIFTRFNNVTS